MVHSSDLEAMIIETPEMRERAKQIDQLLDRLPKIDCKRRCQSFCGPILMSRVERNRILMSGARTEPRAELVCPMLGQDGACTVYTIRPTICRLFGLVRFMTCPHGCTPERWLSDKEAGDILREVERISEGLGPAQRIP